MSFDRAPHPGLVETWVKEGDAVPTTRVHVLDTEAGTAAPEGIPLADAVAALASPVVIAVGSFT